MGNHGQVTTASRGRQERAGRRAPARTAARTRLGGLVAVAVLAVTAVACSGPGGPGHPGGGGGHGPGRGSTGPIAPLSSEGRWLTDAAGRVVMLHGVNEVAKSAPYHPSAFGFGADDAGFLAAQGFNVVRLGVEFQGLMPQPGQIDEAYIESIATTVDELGDEGIFVLLDFHQDGFSPKYNGNGLPDWMAVDDGLPNPPDAVFPLYYVQNPAMQRAFESFWANRPGPDGVGLQDHYVAGLAAVAQRFADDDQVIGYELMNEPFPGAGWPPCVDDAAGCAAIEQALLAPFHQKATAAIREITPDQQVYVEPFVLFNFGQVETSLPGADSDNVLAFHSYALDVAGEEAVVANAVAAAERDGAPVVATEFGATNDPAMITRLAAQMDGGIVPWIFWAYNENVITDRSVPASIEGVRSLDAFRALVRPYPVAVTGTPQAVAFDPATATFDLSYSTTGPNGHGYQRRLETVVSVPSLHYPEGYSVEVTGARVTSDPCAELLTLRTQGRADQVTVQVTPGGDCG
jgi:endoglycosylceramidase